MRPCSDGIKRRCVQTCHLSAVPSTRNVLQPEDTGATLHDVSYLDTGATLQDVSYLDTGATQDVSYLDTGATLQGVSY